MGAAYLEELAEGDEQTTSPSGVAGSLQTVNFARSNRRQARREAKGITPKKSPEAAGRLEELMNSTHERVALRVADEALTWAQGQTARV